MSIRKYVALMSAAALGLTSLSGCGSVSAKTQMQKIDDRLEAADTVGFNRTTYQAFVYSFYDGNGDGIGDLKGIDQKLDYINDGDDSKSDDLGCNQLWLSPIFKAGTYHKYDVEDYESIDPEYGNMEDLDQLVNDCHDRGMTVILDMVINHTSSEHPWFKEASDYLKGLKDGQEPDVTQCKYLDYYNFSREKKDGYVALGNSGWYYEARFTETMPDLNLDSEAVRQELTETAKFWLEDHKIDGFRMDAVAYYYTGADSKNIEFMNWYGDMVKSIKKDAYLVGEAWTNQNTYASYYASKFDSFFDFAFAGQDGVISKVLHGTVGAKGYATAQEKEQDLYGSYNRNYVNAPFYSNHDMARSASYYPGDDGSRTKMAGGLNLLMSGDAFIYYGEEIGMKGSGKDENKRAPMYWSGDADAKGTCKGPANMDQFEMKYDSLEDQKGDDFSIWNYYREAIRVRKAFPAITSGTVTSSSLSDDSICVYTKSTGDAADDVVVVANPKDKEQTVDLSGDTSLDGRKLEMSAVLLTSEDEAKLQDEKLTVPAYGIVILQKK